eukprot:9034332-Pyramimonas_sp.AAC.1
MPWHSERNAKDFLGNATDVLRHYRGLLGRAREMPRIPWNSLGFLQHAKDFLGNGSVGLRANRA